MTSESRYESPSAEQWPFVDRLFHRATRIPMRRDNGNTPARTRPAEIEDPAPLSLTVPDMNALAASDPPLAAVVERRRTIREHGRAPINRDELSEFLYRVAGETSDGRSRAPSAGGLRSLSVYPVVQRCDGLAPAIYRYDGARHRLHRVSEDPAGVACIAEDCAMRAGVDADSRQVVLLLVACFEPLMSKYGTGGYALVLKDAGVLFESMYLAATAMRLAPCAIGAGNSELFAAAAHLDVFEQGTVGEFMLGSLPG